MGDKPKSASQRNDPNYGKPIAPALPDLLGKPMPKQPVAGMSDEEIAQRAADFLKSNPEHPWNQEKR
jgi:hypothetical protein